ncbi:TonB-dependent receptor [Porticoccaceae bacterium]|nr:TonB-dependent receptor [Porticoccaceae bacterium]
MNKPNNPPTKIASTTQALTALSSLITPNIPHTKINKIYLPKINPKINSGFFLAAHYKRCKATSGTNAVKCLVGILSMVCLLLGAANTTAQQENDRGSHGNLTENTETPSSKISATLANEFFISIPPLNAAEALNRLAKQTGAQLLYSYEQALTRKAHPVVGQYSVMDALTQLLKGSGLEGSLSNKGAITISDSEKVAHHNQRERMNMNNKTIAKKTLLAAAVGLFAASGAAVAQDQMNEGARAHGVLEEVIVTAQKREQRLKDIPISISVLGGDELSVRGIADLADIGRAVPGVSVIDSGGRRSVNIRGIANGAGSTPLTGFYLDEIPTLGGESGFSFDLPDLRIYDLERVEVLRGPQGTLYGQGSMGGTIRFITKDPDLQEFGLKTDVTAAFTDGGAPSQKIQGVLNAPVVNDEFGLRIAATFENEGGWVDQPATGLKDLNDANVANVRIKSLWRPTDNLDLELMAVIHRNDGGAPLWGDDGNGNLFIPFGVQVTPTLTDDYDMYNLSVSYDFDGAQLLSSSSYIDTSKIGKNLPQSFPGFGILHQLIIDAEVFNQEIRLTSNGEGPLQWTVGGTYKDLKSLYGGEQAFDLVTTPFELTFRFPINRITTSKAWAIFSNLSYSFTDQIEMGVGVRYFEDDRGFEDGPAPRLESTYDSFSPRLYFNYKVSADVMVYASAAEGFRSGGYNFASQPPYEPESIRTYEIGSKASFMNGVLESEIALFYSEYTDFLVAGILPPPSLPFTVVTNEGDAEVKGVDLTLTWRPIENLAIAFSGNYVDAEIVKINLLSSNSRVGDRLNNIPRYSFSSSINYDFSISGRESYAHLDYSQSGETVLIERGVGFIDHSDEISLLGLKIGMQVNSNVSLQAFADNLLNEDGSISPETTYGYQGRPRPRTVGFKVGIEF